MCLFWIIPGLMIHWFLNFQFSAVDGSGMIWFLQLRPGVDQSRGQHHCQCQEKWSVHFTVYHPFGRRHNEKMNRTERLFVWHNAMIKTVCLKVIRNSLKMKNLLNVENWQLRKNHLTALMLFYKYLRTQTTL